MGVSGGSSYIHILKDQLNIRIIHTVTDEENGIAEKKRIHDSVKVAKIFPSFEILRFC